MSRLHRPSPRGAPSPGDLAVRPPTATLIAAYVALGAAVLGLLVLGAAAFRLVDLRWGIALLGLGAVLAAAIRWRRRELDVEGEALAELAIANAHLERGEPTAAMDAASKAVAAAVTSRTRNRALTALAWAALRHGYAEKAKAVLDRVEPAHQIDLHCLAAVEAARGKTKLAVQALEVARSAGTLTCDAGKLLIDCHLSAFGMERAVLVAMQIRKILGHENCEVILKAARTAGAHAAAAALDSLLRSDAETKGTPPKGQGRAMDPAPARHG
jgi:hypothetical protein